MYRIALLLTVIMASALMALEGCDDDGVAGPPDGNLPPNPPARVRPNSGALIPGEIVYLEWRGHDAEDDPLTYTLYTGPRRYPTNALETGDSTHAWVRTSVSDTALYWAVVAHDSSGNAIPSRTWRIPAGIDFRYPLSEGIEWEYEGKRWYTNVRGSWVPPDTIFAEAVVDDRMATMPDGRFHLLWDRRHDRDGLFPDTARVYEGGTYHRNHVDGLYYFGYENYTSVTPAKKRSDLSFALNGRRFSSLDDLLARLTGGEAPMFATSTSSVSTWFQRPRRSLVYPVEAGRQWTYFDSSYDDATWRVDKKYTHRTTITVPLGTFDCMEVRWLYDLDHDGAWDDDIMVYDYVGDYGLLRRSILVRDVRVSSYDNVDAGLADSYVEWQLTNMSFRGVYPIPDSLRPW